MLAITPAGGNAGIAAAESHARGAQRAPTLIPDALRAAFYRALAKDDSSEVLNAKGCAMLKAQKLTGCFGRDEARFSTPQAAALSLNLAAWGRGAKLVPVAAVAPAVKGEGVSYAHGDLTEWWRVLPLGFEQGFTVAKRPAGSGELTLALRANDPAIEAKGDLAWGKLRYGQLVVTDAKGRVIPATLKTKGKQILIAVNDAQAAYPLTVDPLVWIEQKVTASDGAAGDVFGTSVALSGTMALIGAPEATVNGHTAQGAAYVFTESNGTWTQTAKLTADDGAANDQFGVSVALSGQTALVGAWGANVGSNAGQGAAYVFTESGGTWTQMDKLTAYDGAADADFGDPVALDGTTAMVGEFGPYTGGGFGQGAVYVFNEIQVCGGNYTWQAGQKLQASDGAPNDSFGYSIAVEGGTAVIGAVGATVSGNAGQGAAYVFTGSGGTWTQTQKLVANDGAANTGFGWAVGLSGTTALIGAPLVTINGNASQGAAYIFDSTGGTWTQEQKLTASNGAASDAFGNSVALSGQTALIGAPSAVVNGNYNHGAAYAFSGLSGTWTQDPEITASDNPAYAQFGNAVALSGTTALIGAHGASPGGNNGQGAAYFESPGNLSLALNAPASAAKGAQYQAEVILTNSAATATAAVAAAIPVPSGASFVSATPAQGTCTPGATSIGCALGSLAGNGGTAKVAVTFKATGAVGSSIANTASITNASPAVTASANTAISGTPVVSLSPTSLAFGSVAVGTSATAQTVTLANTGDGDLSNIALSITGTNAADFTETSTCAASLPSTTGSNSCVITVTFKPTAAGARSASLSIASNAAGSPASVALTGTGDAPPVAHGQSVSTPDNASLDGTLTATGTGTLTYAISSEPVHGSVTLTASSGAFVYTPDSGFTGTDSFEFTASDGTVTSQPATVTITVTASSGPSPIGPPVTPTPLVASSASFSTGPGGSVIGKLAASGGNGQPLTYTVVIKPVHGSLSLNAQTGAFTYTPAAGFDGDSFTYTVSDGTATSSPATVTFAKHGGGGGAFGVWGLLLLAPLVGWRKRRV